MRGPCHFGSFLSRSAIFLHLHFQLVDGHVAGDHGARLVEVARLDGLYGQPKVVLDYGPEAEDLALEPVDLSFQVSHGSDPDQPKRPVMYSSVWRSVGHEKMVVVGPNSMMRPWKKKAV